ncbi:hypothetical protein CJF30_00004405 [Rutstroemia sp. NJR-2017a BBW]|nr:hypothetical protein CJF30_00004405 [Rutstroemia sp. NJR-2017a BBW]
MNLDTGSSASASSGPQSRKERGAIATQACDTCRQRKQRCDEQRPCGLCQRLDIPCNYREPQPTKKDKTLTEILDRLKSVEVKVDRLSSRPQPSGSAPPQQSPPNQPPFNASGQADYRTPFPTLHTSAPSPANNLSRATEYRHTTATHKILYWPAIQEILVQADPTLADDLKDFEKEGSSFIVRMQNGQPPLSLHEGLSKKTFVGMQSQAARVAGGTRITYPALTRETMHRLASAYFDTFNFLYPFMDRQSFFSDNLNKVYTEGFDGDKESVIALLIFALGELALESSHGAPISTSNSRPSGVRGGEPYKPPGISLYNEARKQIGFVMSGCELENVQIFSLAAYATTSSDQGGRYLR